MRRRTARSIVAAAAAAMVFSVLGASPASAHPLGNFSINHLDSIRFYPGRVVDEAIVDTAEIPTAQAARAVDADGNGTASPEELSRYAESQCADYLASLSLTVDGAIVTLSTTSTSFVYREGQAGLQTTRLECTFQAAVDLTSERIITFENRFAPNRSGWHEIVATAEGVMLFDSPVATSSVTAGLTNYPVDLLSSPLDVRSASFTVKPGTSAMGPAIVTEAPSKSFFSRVSSPFASAVERVDRAFNDLVGRRQLTVGIGLLAVGLALVLGASHALLPGHGKTVMAAYIAGRQGSVRDAVLVGATVTATHTGGVLLLGLALTLSSSLAGESVLGYLGVISGLMIAVLGVSLLRGASRRRRGQATGHGHSHAFGHHHGLGGHTHSSKDHVRPPRQAQLVGASRLALVTGAQFDALGRSGLDAATVPIVADHVAVHDHRERPVSRLGLVGMGIAGGLVPSPSALVVLLSAIALGRTVFGVVLVIGYGVGMAATLTLAGILLVRLRDRYQDRGSHPVGRARRMATRWTGVAPYLTACLVLVVGLGLALRSLGSI